MIEPLDVTMMGPEKKSSQDVYVAEAGIIDQAAYDSFSDDEFIGDVVDPLDATLDAIVDAARELDNMDAQPRYILLNGFGRRLLAMQKILNQPFF